MSIRYALVLGFALAGFVGFGSHVRADGPTTANAAIVDAAPPVMIVPGQVTEEPSKTHDHWWQQHPLKKCARKCLDNLGVCCWATHNGNGCGSLESEWKFIFGSCRTFYGEPCCRKPPPPPWVNSANPADGNCSCR